MIKATELRIGNKLLYTISGEPLRVGEVTQLYMAEGGGGAIDYHYPLSWAKPISLTPEILEACGFIKFKKNVWRKGQLQWYSHLAYLKNEDTDECYYIPTIVDYLHQLQNLYYALTGEELIYNPK